MPAGTLLQRNVSITVPGTGAAYDITSLTDWEYVVRPTATDSGSALISVTTTANSQGVITIVSATATPQLLLTLYPAATASLAPSQYAQALWSEPGTSSAFTWLSGALVIQGNPQP